MITPLDQETIGNPYFTLITFTLQFGRDFYLAGDVRGHGGRWFGVRVGVLGDKARVVRGDAAEPMGSGRGHLQETVGRMACQYISNT